jgi:hypothetical protein
MLMIIIIIIIVVVVNGSTVLERTLANTPEVS